jgi:hypothetical protein
MRTRRSHPTPIVRSAFAGCCSPPDVIVSAVRWSLRFGRPDRGVEELLAERGVQVDHVTVYRWVQRRAPLLADAARPCRHAVGDRWQVDETCVKVAGRWRHVDRAIDQFGQVILTPDPISTSPCRGWTRCNTAPPDPGPITYPAAQYARLRDGAGSSGRRSRWRTRSW